MLCLVCRRVGDGRLCRPCRLGLTPAQDRFLPSVGVVRSAFDHAGAARTLVHHLKYRGVVAAAAVLAEAMAPLVPTGSAIVPVPRVRWRLYRYGVDPAVELAVALARLCGQPLARLLVAPVLGRARAGRRHGSAPAFRLRGRPTGSVTLVDDVVTSGATLAAAASLVGTSVAAVTATAAWSARVVPGPHEVTSLPAGNELVGGSRRVEERFGGTGSPRPVKTSADGADE